MEVKQTTFQKWQALNGSFIWSNRRPRIGFQHLNKLPSLGGFGLPDLRFYYLAAQVRPIYSFLKSDLSDGWQHCEQCVLAPQAVRDVIWCKNRDQPSEIDSNPYLAHKLKSGIPVVVVSLQMYPCCHHFWTKHGFSHLKILGSLRPGECEACIVYMTYHLVVCCMLNQN